MASTRDVLHQVERACSDGLSAKALQVRVLDLVRTLVPYDGHVFPLTDPVTLISTAPHADVPMLPWDRLPEMIGQRYLTTLNRVDTVPAATAVSLQLATQDPAQSPAWANVQRDLGVTDIANVVFGDRYGTWGYLELWRTGTAFQQSELDALSALAAAVTTGLRQAVARTFVDGDAQLGPVGPAVVLLGSDLHVRQQTEAAAQALLQLLPPDEHRAPIPAAAYNVAAALVARDHGSWPSEPRSRVHLGGGRWITVQASWLGEDIAVAIAPSTTTERLDLFVRAVGLSDREREVITLLGIGLDTRQVADQLFLSEHTVNDHVKAALAKSGSRTRQVLLARIAGRG